jgi:alpha-1,3-glucan synthase
MGMCRFTTEKNKLSTCWITPPTTISLGRSPATGLTCVDADVFTSRQAMPSNKAWQRHGCYHLGSDSLLDLPLTRSALGCLDDWNSLDHFDPTADVRRLYKQFFDLRARYPVLNDGLSLVQNGNWTHQDFLPYSNSTPTERGLWSTSRGGLTPLQNFTYNDTVWLVYTNENTTISYTGNCGSTSGIGGPFQGNTVVRNLLYPFENYTLGSSNQSFFYNGEAPYFGCIESITMQPNDFKAFVSVENWIAPTPALTKFTPGHDARIEVNDNSTSPNSIDIQIEFSDLMDCNSVTQSMNFTLASSGKGSTPSVNSNSVQCQTISDGSAKPAIVIGATVSRWYWKGTIDGVADGILTITISNPQSQNGVGTGVSLILFTGFPAWL